MRERSFTNENIVNYEIGTYINRFYYDEDSIVLYFTNRWPLTITVYISNSDREMLLSHLAVLKQKNYKK